MSGKTILLIALLICVILMPIAGIAALNTLFVGVLFTAAIPIDVWTYLSMLFVLLVVGSNASAKVTKDDGF